MVVFIGNIINVNSPFSHECPYSGDSLIHIHNCYLVFCRQLYRFCTGISADIVYTACRMSIDGAII